jgi:hypothetical protein
VIVQPGDCAHDYEDQQACEHALRARRTAGFQIRVRFVAYQLNAWLLRLAANAGLVFARPANRTFSGGDQIIGDGLVFIEPEVTGVCTYEALIKDAAGKAVKLLLLQSLEQAGADLGGQGDIFEADAPLFPLPPQPVSKRSHLGRSL